MRRCFIKLNPKKMFCYITPVSVMQYISTVAQTFMKEDSLQVWWIRLSFSWESFTNVFIRWGVFKSDLVILVLLSGPDCVWFNCTDVFRQWVLTTVSDSSRVLLCTYCKPHHADQCSGAAIFIIFSKKIKSSAVRTISSCGFPAVTEEEWSN